MPWQEENRMSLRREFVLLARQRSLPFSELCHRFNISRKTGYKWLQRAESDGEAFSDRSRRPHATPNRTSARIEAAVLSIRQQHPAWGGRKIERVLRNQGLNNVPAPSTITHILHRHGLIRPRESGSGGRYQRFEHEQPNQLWQMDFKGYFQTLSGRCDPLTVLDDHSRYNIVLKALWGTNTQSVKTTLTQAFQHYGLPQRMNMDNGQPWGSPRSRDHGLSKLSAWLIRLGIRISFSRPAHPQTNGKDERFHRSLKAEVLQGRSFHDRPHAQRVFDDWREIYNHIRPHEGIGMQVPADRYRPSPRPYPEYLPEIEYGPDDLIRKVQHSGRVSLKHRWILASRGLHGERVAFRPKPNEDGVYDLFYCQHFIKTVNLNTMKKGR